MNIEPNIQRIEAELRDIRTRAANQSSNLPPRAVPVPYTECNYPDYEAPELSGKTMYNSTLDGLLDWVGVVDKAVVLTRGKFASDLFRELAKDVKELAGDVPSSLVIIPASLMIIPGLKTTEDMDGLFDPAAWSAVCDDVSRLVSQTGCREIYLDIEEPARGFVDGLEEPDWGVIRNALKMLSDGIDITFYPYDWPGKDNAANDRLRALACILNERPRTHFVSHQFQGPGSYSLPVHQLRGNWLARVAPSLRWLTHFWGNRWQDEQIVEALELVARKRGPDAQMLVMPGWERWEEGSKAIAAKLKE